MGDDSGDKELSFNSMALKITYNCKGAQNLFCNEGKMWTISHPKSTPLRDGRCSAKQSSSGGANRYLSEITKCPYGSQDFFFFGFHVTVCCFLGVTLLVSWGAEAQHPSPPLFSLSHLCKAIVLKLWHITVTQKKKKSKSCQQILNFRFVSLLENL